MAGGGQPAFPCQQTNLGKEHIGIRAFDEGCRLDSRGVPPCGHRIGRATG